MTTLTVTQQGTATLPEEVLEHLGTRPGEAIRIDLLPDGRAVLKAAKGNGSWHELSGMLAGKINGRRLSIEEINDVVAEAGTAGITIKVDPFPSDDELNGLWVEAWGDQDARDFGKVLARSLAHLGAYEGRRLVGFVNVATDGGVHAFLLDTCVTPAMRGKGIATMLVEEAINVARSRGATWLHVDFEPHLASFYRGCGFRSTEAGLIRL